MSLNVTGTSNLTFNSSNCSSDLAAQRKYVWVHLGFISIIVFTIVGNVLVVLAVLKNRNLQNTTNYFLMSLAIADCLVALIVWPISVVTEFIGYFPFGTFVCNFWISSDILLCTSSIWHMCVMSMDRFFTIKFPLKYGRNKTRKFMLLKIVCVWLISFLISSPMLALGYLDPNNVFNSTTRTCSPNHREFKVYGSVFAFYIPFVIITVTYSFTMRSLKKLMRNKEDKRRLSRERRRETGVTNDVDDDGDNGEAAEADLTVVSSLDKNLSIEKKKEFINLKRSFKVTKTSSASSNGTRSRSIHQQLDGLLEQTNKKASFPRIASFQNKSNLIELKLSSNQTKNSFLSSSITSNTYLFEARQGGGQANSRCHSNNPSNYTTTFHLSLTKLNYASMRTHSDSNLLISNNNNKPRRIYGTTASYKYRLLFELKSTPPLATTSRSINSLIEISSFESSKYRLRRMKKMQTALVGIECEMDKLLGNSKGKKKSLVNNNPIPLKLVPRSPLLQIQPSIDYDSSSLIGYKSKIENKHLVKAPKKNYETFTSPFSRKKSKPVASMEYKILDNNSTVTKEHQAMTPSIPFQFPYKLSGGSSLLSKNSSCDYILRNSSLISNSNSLIKRTKRRRNQPLIALKSNRANNERKALKVLIIIFSIFVVFWTPFFLINLISVFCDQCYFITDELILAITWLGYASSTLNPVIYTMFNKCFRRAFINLLMCRTMPIRDLRKSGRFLVYKNVHYDMSKPHKL